VPPPCVQCRRPPRGERRHADRHPPPSRAPTRPRVPVGILLFLARRGLPVGGAPPPGPPATPRRSGRHASVWQRRARRRACLPPRRLLRGRCRGHHRAGRRHPARAGRGLGGGECAVFGTGRLREFCSTRWASPARRPIRPLPPPCVVRTRVRPRACARARAPPRAPHSRSVADRALVGVARLPARARARARYNARSYATAGVWWCSRRAAELHPLCLCFALVFILSCHPPPRGPPPETWGQERRPFRLCTGRACLVTAACKRELREGPPPPQRSRRVNVR